MGYFDPSGYMECGNKTQSMNDANEADNPKLYRKMSMEEALATIEQRKLQPASVGKDSTKWTSTSLEKLTQSEKLGGFTNYSVAQGIKEGIVEFELNPDYYKYIQKTAVPQRGSKKLPNIKFHYEGLTKKGSDINYGITPEGLDIFNNSDNLINLKILEETIKIK